MARLPISSLQALDVELDGGIDLTDDDFTSSERTASILTQQGEQDYEDLSIGDLLPGPRRVSFSGRVVNLYDQNVESKMPKAAKGCLKVLVKDDRAVVLIKLWYADSCYRLCVGDLITAWTTHISPASSLGNATSAIGTSPAFNLTSIFPERDYGCRIQTSPREQNDSPACRTPIGYGGPQSLLGLIPLNNFIGGGGDEIPEAKVLACVVAVGQPETFISKDGKTISAISVGIRDQAGHATLGLYRLLIPSAQGWTPFETVLLISSPKCLRGGKIIATTKTLIEVDPDIGEAESLRRWVQRENCPVNEKFPGELFDLEAIETSPLRLQFTLASLHSFVTSAPSQTITGYLSVILAKLNMIKIYKKGQLFSMECCGMPIYANTMMGNCGQCGAGVSLRINPDLVSEFADETGAVHNGSTATSATSSLNGKKATHGKVLWSDEAWTSLLGRSPSDLAALCTSAGISSDDLSKLQYLEHRLLWMRVIMLIGWTGEKGGGRLAVLKIIG